MAIGLLQKSTNQVWIDTWKNIKTIVTQREVDKATDLVLQEMTRIVGDKRAGYGWSAGKDSIVLSHIAQRYGISACQLTVTDLEYPATTAWISRNAPPSLTTINTGQNLEWLTRHTDLLFPDNFPNTHYWGIITHRRGEHRFYKTANLEMYLLGRRKEDGNYVGKGKNYYTTSKNMTFYSPLSEWSHELTLGYLAYHNLELPPNYFWENGFLIGTGTWAHRRCESKQIGWEQTYKIDPMIVADAARYFPDAQAIIDAH